MKKIDNIDGNTINDFNTSKGEKIVNNVRRQTFEQLLQDRMNLCFSCK